MQCSVQALPSESEPTGGSESPRSRSARSNVEDDAPPAARRRLDEAKIFSRAFR